MPPDPAIPLIPAATLVVMRDHRGAPPALLMVERAKALAFGGGAMVFPGGRIDRGDHALALTMPGDPEETAARIAAIRETIEEAGVAIALDPAPDAATLARLRAALHAGTPIGTALAAAGLTIAPRRLTPFARWCPRHAPARSFDTRFYLAPLPAGAPPATPDATESIRLVWITARAALAEADAGRSDLLFPTRCNLERLARFPTIAAARADAAAHPVVTITPSVERRDGVDHLVIPAGLGYPVTARPAARARRG